MVISSFQHRHENTLYLYTSNVSSHASTQNFNGQVYIMYHKKQSFVKIIIQCLNNSTVSRVKCAICVTRHPFDQNIQCQSISSISTCEVSICFLRNNLWQKKFTINVKSSLPSQGKVSVYAEKAVFHKKIYKRCQNNSTMSKVRCTVCTTKTVFTE